LVHKANVHEDGRIHLRFLLLGIVNQEILLLCDLSIVSIDHNINKVSRPKRYSSKCFVRKVNSKKTKVIAYVICQLTGWLKILSDAQELRRLAFILYILYHSNQLHSDP